MKIEINHIARMEGHMDFVGSILIGNIARAKIITTEGARLVEATVRGRIYSDAPIITSRICGVCPTVHNLTSIKTIEKAMGVKVSEDIVDLRNLMEQAQVIHSHAAHLFFLSLPDFLDYNNDLAMAKKYPRQTLAAVNIRKFANDILEAVGGRACQPIASEVGGFKVAPDKKKLGAIVATFESVMNDAALLAKLFRGLKYPSFERETEYFSLRHPKEYAIYDGKVVSSKGNVMSQEGFEGAVNEIDIPYSMTKRVFKEDRPFFVGALARLNNNYPQLNKEARQVWDSFNFKLPDHNPFHNIPAQLVEVVHSLIECQKLIKEYIKKSDPALKRPYKVKAGRAVGLMEAPRGILLHSYSIDKNGFIKECNVMTPTVMFLANIEEDLKYYLPGLKKMKMIDRKKNIRKLIRAYDPCVSCATH